MCNLQCVMSIFSNIRWMSNCERLMLGLVPISLPYSPLHACLFFFFSSFYTGYRVKGTLLM